MESVAMKTGALSLAILAAIASPCVMAADSGWYVGANVGESGATIDDEGITDNLQAGGFAVTGIKDDDRDIGFKFFGGYQFQKSFALEGGYFDLGEFGFRATTVPAGTFSGTLKGSGVNIDAVGILPFTEKFSAFGRVGVIYAATKDSFDSTGAVVVADPKVSEREANYKLGVGLEYDFTRHVGMRAEAERYRIDDAVGNVGDIDLFSLGLVVRFGSGEERVAKPRPVATAPPVAPATKAPVFVIVPVLARTEEYCSILDIQFEIDQNDIQREEIEKLGVVGTFMKKYPDTTAVIEGHSDSVGTAEHNMQLSMSRASSVVDYLIKTFQISPSRLTAVGYGETRPLSDNDTQEGMRMNRRIDAVIACATDIEGLAVRPARLTMAMEMEFDKNSAGVRPQYGKELRKVADFLKANPKVTATIEGHTGNMQSPSELSMEISQRRAQNVVNYLVENFGVPRTQLAAQGFGQTRRFAYNTSVEGQQDNRRVNIIFNYPK